jgi:hypothetical protein
MAYSGESRTPAPGDPGKESPMPRSKALLASAVLALCVSGQTTQAVAAADPCQSAIVKSLAKYKKTFLKAHSKCLNNENKNSLAGDACPDAITNLAITKITDKTRMKIASQCTDVAQITGLGYRADCAYEDASGGIEATCEALPVGTVDQFTACMQCWKGAELNEFLAIVYASHANDVCGGDLTETSTICSDLDCATPLPTQKDLGDTGENDCQVGIAKAGIKYLLKREKILETCLLKGCNAAQCVGGTCALYPTSAVLIDKAETVKDALIKKKCGNRDPVTVNPDTFCCKFGGNTCMNILDRPTCAATSGCKVQEGKFCDVDLTCAPAPKTITWWDNCPETNGACPGAAVTTLDQLISCVDTTADAISDELLCFQFPGYPCPVETTTTTTIP